MEKIIINPKQTFQTIFGFGGAFTDATGINIAKLDSPLRTRIVEDYFGKNGLRYSMGRVPIGGTDFSTRQYTYDDTEFEDLTLKNFKLQPEDFQYKV